MTEPVTMTITKKPPADLTGVRELVEKLQDAKRKVYEYRRALSQWEAHKKGLEQRIASVLAGSRVGLIDGREAVTYEAKEQFAHAQFAKDHPEVAIHFMVETVTQALDWNALLLAEPELAGPYQTRIMTVLD